jgi:formate hydrogenlyase subunit 6/NADH:ubiquinone oxidoreductase subunit I/flavodoxin
MISEIYYLTGTGNSMAIARDLAEKIKAKLISVASLIEQDCINTNADIIGFVFPIYDFKPPKLISEFVKKFKNIDSKYIFGVCTYGISSSNAMKELGNIIQSCGGELHAGFTIKMPHNGIGSKIFTQNRHDAMFNDWKNKLDIISEYIITGKKGKLETDNMFFSLILSGLFFKMMPTLFKLFKQILTKGWKSLALIADKKCNSCGICIKICPVKNIEMIKNKPSWSDHCIGCFACFHWCPKESVQLGNTDLNLRRYHHPEINLKDMMH